MARKLRIQYEGAMYHVTVRGVERRRLFQDDEDRRRLLTRLGEAVDEYGVRLYLFCLMRNHIHLLVETPQANLSAFMHKLQTAYTVYFNRRHRRTGHLMEGRFEAAPVQGEEYLLRLSRYIHLNPVFVKALCGQPLEKRRGHLRGYGWSSYQGYAGLGKPWDFVDEGPVLEMVGAAAGKRRRAYRRFVEAGLAETDEEFMDLLKTTRWGIGDQSFQDGIRDLHTDLGGRVRRKEDVSFRREEARLSADAVMATVAESFEIDAAALRRRQYDCVARAVAARMLGRVAGMNQRDIGGYLGMGTGSAVCRQLQRLRQRQVHDRDLAERVTRITTTLAADAEPRKKQRLSIVKG